jgi:hypothetical protein
VSRGRDYSPFTYFANFFGLSAQNPSSMDSKSKQEEKLMSKNTKSSNNVDV